MTKYKNIPALRFKEFEGEWNWKKGSEVFISISDKNHNGDLPILAISQEFGAIPREMIDYKISVTTKSIKSYKIVRKGNFIISLRSFQGGIEYSEYEGICSPAYVILESRFEIVDYFFKVYLKTYNYIIGLNRKLEGIRDGKMISYKYFSEIPLPIPSLPEQQKIANFLTTIDTKIQQLRQKQQLLETYKKGVIQQIFKQEIRFRNDDGGAFEDWEVKRLGEVAIRKTQKNTNDEISFVLTNSATRGIVSQIEYFDKSIANKNNLMGYYVVNIDDFVYNPRISSTAPVGPIKRNQLQKGVMSPLYSVFYFTKGNLKYFEYFFETTYWHRYMKGIANYGVRFDRMNITNADFFKMPIPFPCEAEQQKIATFLSSIDKRIASVKSEIVAMEKYKKGLLQVMFV